MAGEIREIYDQRLIAWLVETALNAEENGSCEVKSVMQSPALFPFRLEAVSSDVLSGCGRLEVVHHGLDVEMVVLRQRGEVARMPFF